MQARLRFLFLLLLPMLLLAGCIFSPKKTVEKPPPEEYLPQTSPENVMKNLQTSYKYRNIEKYCEQFHYDFRFEFDPGDIDPETQPDAVWFFQEDSLSTRNMFKNENLPEEQYRVLAIRINLTYGNSVPSNEPGREGQRYILVTNVALDVDTQGAELGTVTYRVPGDQADFFFKKGRAAADTTSNLWYIIGWRDRPVVRTSPTMTTASARVGSDESSSWAEPVEEAVHWGRLKGIYQ